MREVNNKTTLQFEGVLDYLILPGQLFTGCEA